MTWNHSRLFRALVALTGFAAVTLSSPPTTSSISEQRPLPPSTAEVVALDELRQWVDGDFFGPGPVLTRSARSAALVEAIYQRPESFELFRSYHPNAERRKVLSQLPYGDLIARAAARHKVDPLLVAAVVEAESSFNPYAISPVGAMGLMQVMPITADYLGGSDPLDPGANLDLGARYLRRLMRQFDGDLVLALAGYNAGPGSVLRHGGLPPYRETRAYVGRVLTRYIGYNQDIWRAHLERDWYLG